MMPEQVQVTDSIRNFSADGWNACFPGTLEGWGYLLANEEVGPDGFSYRYYGLFEAGQLVAAVPGFRTLYRLDTTVTDDGVIQRIMHGLCNRGWLTLKMACLGSPVTEYCAIGFAPGVTEDRKAGLARRLIAAFEQDAAAAGIGFLAIKDARNADAALWLATVGGRYQQMPGLPTAWLPVRFASVEDYLAGLSKATRKDVRRKLRGRDAVRIEWRTEIDDVADAVHALYEQTRARSSLQFEHLPKGWFQAVLAENPGASGCFLYWVGDALAGFNLLLLNETCLLDKFVGLDGTLGHAHNLYILSWIRNLELCLERRIPLYISGQAEYEPKRRLDCSFSANWLWFRHRNSGLNWLLMTLGRYLRLDRHDPDLLALLENAS